LWQKIKWHLFAGHGVVTWAWSLLAVNPMLSANFTALSSMEAKLLQIEVLHRDFRPFCSCNFDIDPMTFIHERPVFPHDVPNDRKWTFYVAAFKSTSVTYVRSWLKTLPSCFTGGNSIVLVFVDGHSAVEDRWHRVGAQEEEGWCCWWWCSFSSETWRGPGAIGSQWLVFALFNIILAMYLTAMLCVLCRVCPLLFLVLHKLTEVQVFCLMNLVTLSYVPMAWDSVLGYYDASFVLYQ